MDIGEAINRFEVMATAFYQERIQDGLSLLENVVSDSLHIFVDDNPIMIVMDSIDKKDYVMAADVLHYEMYLPVKRILEEG